MSTENCGKWRDALSECARGGTQPAGRLWEHLNQCASCAGQYDAELALGRELRELRSARAGERSRDVWRRRLMARFAEIERLPARPRFGWAWAPASAALLVLASVQVWIGLPKGDTTPSAPVTSEEAAAAGFSDLDEGGDFIPVPYALPLAAGESVRVVRRELNGADLVRMGIDLPDDYAADLADDFEANVVLGEDGLPRAVQLVSDREQAEDDSGM
jgi:hypothetical protein